MTERRRNERKKVFTEIMESLTEYSTEEIDDSESVKAEILQLLKTHRAVKLSDYEYGLSRALKKDHRLIIKEPKDGSKVREYSKTKTSWICLLRTSRCKSSNLFIVNGIVFAPIDHNENCETKEYSFAMEMQNLLKQGKVREANSLLQRGSKILRKFRSFSSSSTSSLSESTLSDAADQNEISILDDIVFETTASIPSTLSPTVLENFSSDSNEPAPASSSLSSNIKREAKEEIDDDCIIIDERLAKKPKIEEQINLYESYEFHHPSTFLLKQVCKKFNFDKKESYQNGFNFWRNIIFLNILTVANKVLTHSFKSSNIFACLSLLFTGKADSCFLIQHVINGAFREDPVFCANKSNEEVNQILINNIVSDEQIEFIAKFLGCRIGCYYGKTLKKFGKWESQSDDDEEDILTLILSFDAGLFSVVLDLS